MLDRFFGLQARGTTVRTEVVAGLTTFLSMSYIIFVNPDILSQAGMDPGAVFVATCLAAAVGSLIMGAYANYPIAIAPGMGLNAFFTYGVVIGMGVAWQTALMAVFMSGTIFVILSLLPVREWIINSIPMELKLAIGAGIGFFLIIIGLTSVGIVVDNPATLVGLGDLSATPTLLAILCFVTIAILETRKVPGGILLGMLGITILGMLLGVAEPSGIVSAPPSIAPTFLQLDWAKAFEVALIAVVISFLFVDMFDTAGTLVSVAHKAGLLDENGHVKNLRKALLADSTSTMIGAALGTSSATSYVESIAGVNAGGRTGLTAIVVGIMFLVALFFAPLAGAIQSYATGPALVFVGCVMVGALADIDWDDATCYVPSVITAVAMPLTYSIATGLGLGFIAYTAIKIGSGKWKELSVGVIVLAALFLAKFIFLDAA
ncbi:NCS2 family permease [Henriciella sp. AS95]|uniref:NCS2 family permease n=1 Tax=Henriciella sp. AS95 TaxID=3135782 RepID=UPI0031795E97